jgi:hypothetical protein
MRSTMKLALLVSAPVLVLVAGGDNRAFGDDTPPAAPAPAAPAPADAPAPVTAPAPAAAPSTVTAVSVAPASAVLVGPAATASPASTDGTLLVHLDSPSTVSLEHRAGPQAAWEHACDSPCDARLPVADQYRIVGGPDINASNPFILDGSKGDRAVLYVAPGSKTRQKIGTGILIGGAVVAVGGAIAGFAASCPSCDFNQGTSTDNRNWLAIGVGTGLAVVGISAGIFGAAWLVDNGHSRVSGAVQAAPPARGSNDPVYVTGMRATMPPMTQSFAFPVMSF